MYIPKLNLTTDQNEITAFMQKYSFATIVTSKSNYPTATHLPFVISRRNDKIILTSHFAKANTHWKDLIENQALVIFSEPHAYISPRHYDKKLNVPTWNYVAVHAYGTAKLLEDTDTAFVVLESMIDTYETDYRNQWSQLPADYKLNMLKGIVAFEIEVTELQGKKKLSQNKSAAEQNRIIAALENSENTAERETAYYMKAEKQKGTI